MIHPDGWICSETIFRVGTDNPKTEIILTLLGDVNIPPKTWVEGLNIWFFIFFYKIQFSRLKNLFPRSEYPVPSCLVDGSFCLKWTVLGRSGRSEGMKMDGRVLNWTKKTSSWPFKKAVGPRTWTVLRVQTWRSLFINVDRFLTA